MCGNGKAQSRASELQWDEKGVFTGWHNIGDIIQDEESGIKLELGVLV